MQIKSLFHLILFLSFVGTCSALVAEYFVVKPSASGCNATDVPVLDQIIKTAIRSNVGPNVRFTDEEGGENRRHHRSLATQDLTALNGVTKCSVTYCNSNPSACLIMGCTLDCPSVRALRVSSGESMRRMQVKEEDQHGFSVLVTRLLHATTTENTACDTSDLRFIFRYRK